MAQSVTAVPAYGRDYKSKAEVKEAWEADKDFQTTGFGAHGAVNKSDADRLGIIVNIRYDRMTKSVRSSDL